MKAKTPNPAQVEKSLSTKQYDMLPSYIVIHNLWCASSERWIKTEKNIKIWLPYILF